MRERGKIKDIKDLTFEELKTELRAMGAPAYRAAQIFAWLYQKGASTFEEFTDLPKTLREALAAEFSIAAPELFAVFRSQDQTQKFLFKLADGCFIETVLIPAGGRTTACLSTQVGCKYFCAFCASGRKGFIRNLTPAEIVNQVLFLKQTRQVTVSNIVFMGMGEPLDNYGNLEKAIRIMNSAEGMGIAARRMTVSTAGIIPAIKRFKNLGLQVNLSISLHAASEEKRTRLMPVNKKFPLAALMDACQEYIKGGGRKLTLEYVLIGGTNDSQADADDLARIARRLRAKVNLIPYSPVEGLNFDTPSEVKVCSFMDRLEEHCIPVTLRRSKGSDIQAACGQLALRGVKPQHSTPENL